MAEADGSFLMPRYLGSEDEDSIESADDVKSTNVLCKDSEDSEVEKSEPKKKCFKISAVESPAKVKKISENKKKSVEISETVKEKNSESLKNELYDEDNKTNSIKSTPVSTSKKRKSKAQSIENGDVPIKINDSNLMKDNNFCTIGQARGQNIEKFKPIVPKWLSKPAVFGNDLREQEIPVSELPYLDDISKKNLKELKINFLFPVQLAVIPWLMKSNLRCLYRPSDLCVSAPTGSGKTLAFVLPIVQSIKNRIVCAVRAIVVLPVSELAIQVFKVFEMFTRGTDLKVCILTGQKSFAAEQKILVESRSRRTLSLVDIIVTTPGRILDHIYRTEGFCLKQLQYLVIDEADRMMHDIQKGWLKQLEDAVFRDCDLPNCVCSAIGGKRISSVPATACQTIYINQPLQKLLFSATLTHDPEKLHTLSLYKPKLFTAQVNSDDSIGKCTIPDDLTVISIVCKDGTKPIALYHFIKERQFKKVLCFTQSVERAQRLHLILAEMGNLQVREISSNNRPVQRKIILTQFALGKVDILVCSDLVARGIDIEGVDCVVSYDVPNYVNAYVHRIGRTARAGKSGTAVTLLTKAEIPSFKKTLKMAGIPIPSEVSIDDKDLEMYISSFKNALEVADSKVRKLKTEKALLNTGSKSRKRKLSNPNRTPLETSCVETK